MGICRSSKNNLNEKGQYNMIKPSDQHNDYQENTRSHNNHHLVYHNLSRKSVINIDPNQSDKTLKTNQQNTNSVIQKPIENEIRPKWTKLSSVSELKQISHTISISNDEMLIIPTDIQKDIDLIQIPTYFYKYNMKTDKYSKSKPYPHDFPKGSFTACFDKDNQTIYMFIERGYIISYNIASNEWKYDIIYGINNLRWNRKRSLNDSCSAMVDNRFHIISGKQHIIWNKNTKEIKVANKLDVSNYGKMIHRKHKGTLLLIGNDDALNAENGNFKTLDTMYSYSLKYDHWMKLKSKLPFGLSSFGYILTMEQRYVLIFGGKQLPFDQDYDGILIMDLKDFTVRKSAIKCPVDGSVVVCNMVDYKRMDLIIKGVIRKYLRSRRFKDVRYLSDDIIGVLKMFYCIENVHLFGKDGNNHWKMDIDCILK